MANGYGWSWLIAFQITDQPKATFIFGPHLFMCML